MMRRRMVDRCACEAIGRPGWAVSGPMISFCTIPPRESEGAASKPATPSTDSTPAGATDAGRQSWYEEGTGLTARPQGTPASGGDGCQRIAPLLLSRPEHDRSK